MDGLLTYVFWPLGVMLHSGKTRWDLAAFFYCRHALCFLSPSSRHPFYSSFNQFHFSPLTSKCGSSCQVAKATAVARQHTTLHHPFQKSDRWTRIPRQEWEKKWGEGDKGRVKMAEERARWWRGRCGEVKVIPQSSSEMKKCNLLDLFHCARKARLHVSREFWSVFRLLLDAQRNDPQ